MVEVKFNINTMIKKAKKCASEFIFVRSITAKHCGFILKFPSTKYLAFGVNGVTYCQAVNSLEKALDFLAQRIFFEDLYEVKEGK